MHNRIRPYAWGSRTALAELTGAPSPSQHPQAELWMGAHPGDPSSVVRDGAQTLVQLIAEDPAGELGVAVAERFGQLPFLLKVLAAAEPLSLQAHPSQAQAQEGYHREDREGVPLASANRNYKDRNHKPELICALTEFHALCGFREPAQSVQVLAELGVPQLDHYLSLLSGQPDAEGVRALFSSILTVPSNLLQPLLSAVLAACVERIGAGSVHTTEYRTALELGERYPGDPGVLASLLLNRITLGPGQALFLPAGNLHAYLSGVGIEIMANSDNVLRGGLTPKHVDVPELMRVLDFTPGDVAVLSGHPTQVPGEWTYDTPMSEFRFSRIEVGPEEVALAHDGPQVLLVIDGQVRMVHGDQDLTVPRGSSVWVPARDREVRVSGTGTVVRATDGLT